MNISVWGPYTGWVIHSVDSDFFLSIVKIFIHQKVLSLATYVCTCMYLHTHTQVQPHSINSRQLRSSKYRYFSSKILKIQ